MAEAPAPASWDEGSVEGDGGAPRREANAGFAPPGVPGVAGNPGAGEAIPDESEGISGSMGIGIYVSLTELNSIDGAYRPKRPSCQLMKRNEMMLVRFG
jgi:hypothetical protein